MVAGVEAFSGGDDGTFRIASYSGFMSKGARFAAGGFEPPDVADACERLWEDFRRREARAIGEVFG